MNRFMGKFTNIGKNQIYSANILRFQQRKFAVSLNEFSALKLLKNVGAPVLEAKVASTPRDAARFSQEMIKLSTTNRAVMKALVLSGGRGLGKFVNGLETGIKIVEKPAEAQEASKKMLGHRLVTKQTGVEGLMCSNLMIVPEIDYDQIIYTAFLIDRQSETGLTLLGCAEGGVTIEEIAKTKPEAIVKVAVTPDGSGLSTEIDSFLHQMNLKSDIADEMKTAIKQLFTCFKANDCTMAEINPVLIQSSLKKLYFADAKINVDESALFRQAEVSKLHKEQKSLYEASDKNQTEPQGDFNYVKLDGNIGCLVNGAGLAMGTMDLIASTGNKAANFLDVGGGSDLASISAAIDVLFSDPDVKVIFINIFGGIVNCKSVADSLVTILKQKSSRKANKIPIVARFAGNGSVEALSIVNNIKNIPLRIENDLNKALKLVENLASK